MDSTSYSTYTSSQDASPVRVNFARPLCFCGFTAVSIYPEPPSTTDRRSRSAQPPPPPPPLLPSPAVKKSNWVYECHFSPKQSGMMAPDPCEDCERERKRRTAQGSLLVRNTKELTWFVEPNLSEGCERHRSVKYDNVELWPRKKPVTATTSVKHDHHRDHTATTDAAHKKTVVGADIQVDAIRLNAAPMDGHKVCGFHMHALEWHHMQTLDVNQILKVAKDASCDYFHLSVVRWLGDLAKTTTIKNCNIDTNYHLGLKLFRKVHCFCGKDAALARGPAVASNTSSSQPTTTSSNRSNNDNTGNKEYFIMCAGRVYDKHTDYEMVLQPGTDAYYNYNIRSWINKSGGFNNCSLQIRLQKAIFDFNLLPIHSRIPMTDWLSQWFKPISLTPQTQALTVFPSELLSFEYTNELLTTIRDPTAASSSKASAAALPVPLIPITPRPTLTLKGLATVQDGPSSLMGLSTGAQVKERDQLNCATGLYELDKELNEALGRHAAAVESIKERMSMLSSQSEEQDRYHKEIDMTGYPSVAMLLCDKCKNSNSCNFCVIPRARPSSPFSPPPSPNKHKLGQGTTTTTANQTTPTTLRSTYIHLPSPEGSDDEHIDAPGAQVDELFDLLDPLTGLIALETKLDQADQELEHTVTRHAMVFERTMEIRSRLVLDFIQCRGCCFREAGLDVLPCHHHFLCAECVERIEFYLVLMA